MSALARVEPGQRVTWRHAVRPPVSLPSMAFHEPTQEQLAAIMARPDEPVVMGNLLRYKRDAAGNVVGHESYLKYSEAVLPMLTSVGGAPLWGGRADSVFIGDDRDDWDAVVVVQYPSPSAFVQMVSSEEYTAIHHLRIDGLETTAIVACTPGAIA